MTTMSKSWFRSILVTYALLAIVPFPDLQKSLMPESVREAQQTAEAALENQTAAGKLPLRPIIMVTVIAFYGLELIGVVGMFLFWRPGRYLFLIGSIGSILGVWLERALYSPWQASTIAGRIPSVVTFILMGALIAAVFLGSAKHLFEEEKTI